MTRSDLVLARRIDALYGLEQAHSTTLKDQGSGLPRADIDSSRDRKR